MVIPIYVGTDCRMWKSDRVLRYTICQHASLPVEITWMRAGEPGWTVGPSGMAQWNIGRETGRPYSKQGWATDFSCFRWAVPAVARAAGHSRAIYFDTDMALFADVAELYDADLRGQPAGCPGKMDVLVIDTDHDFWDSPTWPSLDEIKSSGDRPPRYSRVVPHTVLDRHWDETGQWTERTKLYHWTAMGSQPWRPWPEAFDYDAGGEGPEHALWWRLYEESGEWARSNV